MQTYEIQRQMQTYEIQRQMQTYERQQQIQQKQEAFIAGYDRQKREEKRKNRGMMTIKGTLKEIKEFTDAKNITTKTLTIHFDDYNVQNFIGSHDKRLKAKTSKKFISPLIDGGSSIKVKLNRRSKAVIKDKNGDFANLSDMIDHMVNISVKCEQFMEEDYCGYNLLLKKITSLT